MAPRHNWIPKEDTYIKQSYMTLSRGQMAKHLKVTVDILSTHMARIEIRRYKPWNKEEDEDAYILKNYKRRTCVQMAEYLDRTPSILRTRLWKLGLRRYEKNVSPVTLPPNMDLMDRTEYKPVPWQIAREGAMDFMNLPSGLYGPEVTYRRGHP